MYKVVSAATVALAIVVSGCYRGEITDNYSFNKAVTGQLTELSADIDSASLIVEPTESGRATVEVDVDYFWRRADFDAWIDGDTLYVDLECHPSCRGDVIVRVPARVSVDADAGSGNVEISDLDGDIRAHSGSGNVKIENTVGDLHLSTGSGNIKGRELGSFECDADAGSGNVSLTFTEKPTTLKAKAGSGNVDLKVPFGRYDIDLEVGSGWADADNLVNDPRANKSIKARAGSGNVKVNLPAVSKKMETGEVIVMQKATEVIVPTGMFIRLTFRYEAVDDPKLGGPVYWLYLVDADIKPKPHNMPIPEEPTAPPRIVSDEPRRPPDPASP